MNHEIIRENDENIHVFSFVYNDENIIIFAKDSTNMAFANSISKMLRKQND